MKNIMRYMLLVLLATIGAVNAEESAKGGEDYVTYCTEQAQLAGIEGENELKSYIKDCVDSYVGPTGE